MMLTPWMTPLKHVYEFQNTIYLGRRNGQSLTENVTGWNSQRASGLLLIQHHNRHRTLWVCNLETSDRHSKGPIQPEFNCERFLSLHHYNYVHNETLSWDTQPLLGVNEDQQHRYLCWPVNPALDMRFQFSQWSPVVDSRAHAQSSENHFHEKNAFPFCPY